MPESQGRWLDEDFISEGVLPSPEKLVVFSRDWTVETMFSQIEKGNIDLNPKFQRRNAWSDEKRCRLIESLITGMPVPEIVLAENPNKPKSYIVIDGKQRLMTIAGYMNPEKYQSWLKPKLGNMAYRSELNGKSYGELEVTESLVDYHRALVNADVRCTVLSNISSNEILYDIFYRLNTGSVPLSAQELRQVLHSGPFADFLIEKTDKPNPIQVILDLDGPDDRLVDAELLLRLISFRRYHSSYSGNLNAFLEYSMGDISSNWDKLKDEISAETDNIFAYLNYLHSLVPGKVGRKFVGGKWLTRFNKSIFEVEILSLMASGNLPLSINGGAFQNALEGLFSGNAAFLRSVEATTKSLDNYQVRFGAFQEMLASVVGKDFKFIPGKP